MLSFRTGWVSAMLVAGFSVCLAETPGWPAPTQTMRPWCYNWWMGNAIDAVGIEKQSNELAEAGFGGFHGITIYEAKAPKHPPVAYLSEEWKKRFDAAAASARTHDLDLDLSMGCGWCFGGPWLRPEQGVWRLQRESDPRRLRKNAKVIWKGTDPKGRTVVLAAYPSGQQVKRAPASGKGPMLDPFSPEAMRTHLTPFTRVFDTPNMAKPRCFYHDSYEYFEAGWTPKFFEAFRAKRGYDLRDHLPAFAGVGSADEIRRIKHDYRETLSDLLLDTFSVWTDWCRAHGISTRNEAHGCPGNWLDFYALADIPETEMFNGDRDILVSKFASSAAHLKGTPLVSSESCTWINEHFNATLDEIQVFLNQLLLSGVNHVFYHGCCYSPADAAWPGWCFYASLEMNPRNPIWYDVSVLNAWLTRVQSLAQTSTPDEDVLLYWPIHDTWRQADGYVKDMSVHNAAKGWFGEMPVGRLARRLYADGISFDYISDRQLATLPPAAQTHWKTIVVPRCETMPAATGRALARLAKLGYRVMFEGKRPTDVPGWKDAATERAALAAALAEIPFDSDSTIGRTVPADPRSPSAFHSQLAGRCEPFTAAHGLAYRRFRRGDDTLYFIVANSTQDVHGVFQPSVSSKTAWKLDPMTAQITSIDAENGINIDLPAGESVWFWLSPERGQTPAQRGQTPTERGQPPAQRGQTPTERGQTLVLDKAWSLTPVCGGPEGTGPVRTMDKLVSWSYNADGSENPFSGTVCYRTTFTLPPERGQTPAERGQTPEAGGQTPVERGQAPVILDLGKVRHSARVRVNGTSVGVRIRAPYQFEIPRNLIKNGENVLEVDVTSTGANRIRDLDRQRVNWKIFTDINIVGRDYRPFNASKWPLAEAGLLGPVTLSVP